MARSPFALCWAGSEFENLPLLLGVLAEIELCRRDRGEPARVRGTAYTRALIVEAYTHPPRETPPELRRELARRRLEKENPDAAPRVDALIAWVLGEGREVN